MASRGERDDPAERKSRLEATLNEELKLKQTQVTVKRPDFEGPHMSYDYGTDNYRGARNPCSARREAAKQVIGGILEVFPAYGAMKAPLGEVRRLMEAISGVEEHLYANAAELEAQADPNWLRQRDALSGSIDEVNRLHASIARSNAMTCILTRRCDTPLLIIPPHEPSLSSKQHLA